MPEAPTSDQFAAWRAALKLREFIELAWPVIEPGTTFKPGRHIDEICAKLEAVTRGECKRLIVNVPPRHMKSLIISVAWPAWVWLTQPEKRFLCASYAQDLSIDDNVKCRSIVQSEGGQEVGGLIERVGYQGLLKLLEASWDGRTAWELTGDQNEKRKFTNSQRGYRAATSVGGTVTGLGGDVIILDDPNKTDDAHSEAARKAVRKWLDGTLATRLNDPDKGAIVIVQQRVHEDDATGHLLKQDGWEHVCLPAEFEPEHPYRWDGDWRTEAGELLWPEHYGPGPLVDLKARMPAQERSGQLQQRPAPAEGGLFKADWWQHYPSGVEWEKALRFEGLEVVQSWDFRFTDSKKTGDWVVGQLWGFHGPDAYLLGQVRGRLSFTESQAAMLAMTEWAGQHENAAFRRGSAKLVEEKANGAAIIQTLRRVIAGVIAVRPTESKEARAAAVTPRVESGNVFLPSGDHIPCPPGYEPTSVADFKAECSMFPAGSHDDQVDCLSQVLAWRAPREAPGPTPGALDSPVAHRLSAGVRDRKI
jgi:predicted phage terminase large subunit-like protein